MYIVTWEIPFSQGTDYLGLLQRTGEKPFGRLREAREFIGKIKREGFPKLQIFPGEIIIKLHSKTKGD